MEKIRALAQTHLTKTCDKAWYDQKALVMLLSQENKLLAKCKGPFKIKNQIGPTTYEVAIPGQDQAGQIRHVNLLKKWVSRPEQEHKL